MGTPELAATVLRAVAGWPAGRIVAVYTQPDRPAGRGHKLTPSPVKVLAQSLGLPVEQPLNFKDEESCRKLAEYKPDFLLVAAYGLLLPVPVIETPRFPPLNVHTSLLPRYRGAAPIQRALMENWEEGAQTGVSIMEIVQALDAGPVYAQEALPLAGHTGGTLHDALAETGGRLLLSVLDQFAAGTAHAVPQDETQATYAAKLSKADGYVDWNAPAAAVDARIRAVTPWPGARSLFHFVFCPAVFSGMVRCCGLPVLMPGMRWGACVLRARRTWKPALSSTVLSAPRARGCAVVPSAPRNGKSESSCSGAYFVSAKTARRTFPFFVFCALRTESGNAGEPVRRSCTTMCARYFKKALD